MGHDYALVHLKYTIPPAIALTFLYRPFCTKLDLYKVFLLITIAVVSTTPWDSYLIKSRIWTYPPNAILGPTLFRIPAEEVFFFIIQTYLTSLLYLLLSKPTFHPAYLFGSNLLRKNKSILRRRYIGATLISSGIVAGGWMIMAGGEGLYMGLILVWAGPFILFLWTLAYQFILALPKTNTLLPILLPTLYLWIVDTLALKRGTWTIESGTKLGYSVWTHLDVEEAVFFLLTNVLIVLGLVAFDNAYAILQTFPNTFRVLPSIPSPVLLVQALLLPVKDYDEVRLEGLQQSLRRLRAKSRSFYLASGVFSGRLRIDLILLYSFCRVADDLVDEARTTDEARAWIRQLRTYLDLRYGFNQEKQSISVEKHIDTCFPADAQATLRLLPTSYLSPNPLYDLLAGFETDLDFASTDRKFPMSDLSVLEKYGEQVAGTVAESCLELVYHHTPGSQSAAEKEATLKAGRHMGVALQYVNIARDIAVDAANGRVYLPSSWLKENDLHPADVIRAPNHQKVEGIRQRLLDTAMVIYKESKHAIEDLPVEARAPMRVAVESYVEIGRVLKEPSYRIKAGRATVPKIRRLRVALKALQQG